MSAAIYQDPVTSSRADPRPRRMVVGVANVAKLSRSRQSSTPTIVDAGVGPHGCASLVAMNLHKCAVDTIDQAARMCDRPI